MKIAGLDICKGYAVAWILDEFPSDPKKVFKAQFKSRSRDPKKDLLTFSFCHDVIDKKTGELEVKGIDTFLSWGVDAVCMEPTGMRYSAFIAKVCQHHNIKIFWVKHSECKAFRDQSDLPDKNDIADAFALACYAQLYGYLNNSSYFIRFESGNIPQLRDLYMAHKFFTRQDTQLLNRIQQHLSYEFPEIDLFKNPVSQSNEVDNRRPLICEIADIDRQLGRKSTWHNRLKKSIAKEYGIDLGYLTKLLAKDIDTLDLRLMDIEEEMKAILNQFPTYQRVFDEFNFGIIHRSILLCQIYPFSSRFDNPDSFKRRLGLARVEVQSGTKRGDKKGSSSALCRREWYLWVCQIAKLHKQGKFLWRPDSELIKPILDYHDKVNAQFSNNPEDVQKSLADKYKHRVKAQLVKALNDDLPIATVKQIVSSLDLENMVVPKTAISKGFGNLVIMKTAGYACKKLYWSLDAVRSELE